MLVLPVVYLSLFLLTIVLCFAENNWAHKFKKTGINIHLTLFIVFILDLSVFNFNGLWLDRIIVIAFLLSGSATFSLYRKSLQLWKKVYFGLFVFYPLIAPLVFFIDRIAFILAISPFLATLIVPETRYRSQDYEIRVPIGVMSGRRLQLIHRGFITETFLGNCNNQDVQPLEISGIEILSQNLDSTKAIILSKGKRIPTTFYRKL